MKRGLALLLGLLAALPALGQPQIRGGSDEWSMNLLVVGSKQYQFEGGASVRNDGGFGLGLSAARNLNEHFSIGTDFVLSQFDFRARVAPAPGNTASAFDTHGTMETAALRLNATWNLLARPFTPFLTAGLGVTYLDTDLATDPPDGGCWSYPWHGIVCTVSPGGSLVRFTYGAAAGLRYDISRDSGFLRLMVGAEYIEIPEAVSTVGYVQVRADFGIRF
jgi:opacity protein-like surface antigen